MEDIRVIENHTKNVQKVVQDLLKLSRQKQVISGKCSINDVVTDAIKVFQAQSASKEIRLTAQLQAGLSLIKCDAGILEQILTNLWINAFDALQETGGDVRISTRYVADRNEVLLCIEDTGPGIPEQILDQIFDPFFTTKEVGKGTGLGLAVVYGFINELGGRIEVESHERTRFNIYFPIAEEQQGQVLNE
jgi:signal transduction histidine kinase